MMKKPSKGFVFGGRALDGKTIIYVNVCGHEDIQPPQGPSGMPVNDAYIDRMGVENLQIPIAVGNPVEVPLNNNSSASSNNNSKSKVQEVASSSNTTGNSRPKQQQQQFKQFIIEVVIHKMLADRCRCVWNTGGTPQSFDQNVQPERKVVVFRIAKLALDWVQREAGLVIHPDSVRLIFNTAYQTPPTAQHTSSDATGPNSSQNALPSPAEMMEFMKRMGEKRNGDGGNNLNSSSTTGGGQQQSMEEMMMNNLRKAQQQQNKNSSSSPSEAPSNKANENSKNVLSGENDGSSMIFSASNKNNNEQQKASSTKGPLIQEVNNNNNNSKSSSVIKKGFLNSSKASGALYGDKGTSEGVLPDGAGDPIGYMPKTFRDRCKVVDMRGMETDSESMQKAVEAAQNTSISGKPVANNNSSENTAPATKGPSDAPKMSFSHQQQKSEKQEQEPTTTKKSAIVIEEVDSSDTTHTTTTTSSSLSKFNFQCAPDWKLSSAKIDQTTNQIQLSLQPPPTSASGVPFSVADLDLEVTTTGLKAQSEESGNLLFSVGDTSSSSNKFSISDWMKMLDVVDGNLSSNNNKKNVTLDSDGAKAKFKKTSRELTLTIPLLVVE